jgi:hypothetical protein
LELKLSDYVEDYIRRQKELLFCCVVEDKALKSAVVFVVWG